MGKRSFTSNITSVIDEQLNQFVMNETVVYSLKMFGYICAIHKFEFYSCDR